MQIASDWDMPYYTTSCALVYLQKTKRLQHHIAFEKQRQMIGVRRISIPVAVKKDMEEATQIRPNSQLLNRWVGDLMYV